MNKEQKKDLAFVQTNVSYTDKVFYHNAFKKEYRYDGGRNEFLNDLKSYENEYTDAMNIKRNALGFQSFSLSDISFIIHGITVTKEFYSFDKGYYGLTEFKFTEYNYNGIYSLSVTPVYWDNDTEEYEEEASIYFYEIGNEESMNAMYDVILNGKNVFYIYDDSLNLVVIENKSAFEKTNYEIVKYDKNFDKDVLDKINKIGNLIHQI